VGCYIWYGEEGSGWGPSPPRPLLAVPCVTAHPSTASVPTIVLLYDSPFLCGLIVALKGLMFNLKALYSNININIAFTDTETIGVGVEILARCRFSREGLEAERYQIKLWQ